LPEPSGDSGGYDRRIAVAAAAEPNCLRGGKEFECDCPGEEVIENWRRERERRNSSDVRELDKSPRFSRRDSRAVSMKKLISACSATNSKVIPDEGRTDGRPSRCLRRQAAWNGPKQKVPIRNSPGHGDQEQKNAPIRRPTERPP